MHCIQSLVCTFIYFFGSKSCFDWVSHQTQVQEEATSQNVLNKNWRLLVHASPCRSLQPAKAKATNPTWVHANVYRQHKRKAPVLRMALWRPSSPNSMMGRQTDRPTKFHNQLPPSMCSLLIPSSFSSPPLILETSPWKANDCCCSRCNFPSPPPLLPAATGGPGKSVNGCNCLQLTGAWKGGASTNAAALAAGNGREGETVGRKYQLVWKGPVGVQVRGGGAYCIVTISYNHFVVLQHGSRQCVGRAVVTQTQSDSIGWLDVI